MPASFARDGRGQTDWPIVGFHTPAAGNTMTEPELQTQLQTELDPDFQIVRLLGEGSMALVYVAREKALQRLVAIKVLKAELASVLQLETS